MNWEKIGNKLYKILYDNGFSKTLFWTVFAVLVSILVGMFVVWIIPDWAPAYGTLYHNRILTYLGIGFATIVVLAIIILLIAILGDADWID